MTTELAPKKQEDQSINMKYQGGSSEAVYGLGLIGAWIYYIGKAKTFREGLLGFFKAFVWPVILVYEALKLLNKE